MSPHRIPIGHSFIETYQEILNKQRLNYLCVICGDYHEEAFSIPKKCESCGSLRTYYPCNKMKIIKEVGHNER